MCIVIVSVALLSAVGSWPMVFLFPDDLVNAQGIVLEAQRPEAGMVLMPKDEARPKLWYSPAASWAGDGRVLIWYQRVDSGEAEYSEQRTLCVGEVRDGAWSLPALGGKTPSWGGPDNVCMQRSPYKSTWGGFNVFQIVHVGASFKMVYWDQPSADGEAGGMLASSRDGFVWEKEPVGAVFTERNDAFSLLVKDGEYLLYQTALEDWPEKPYPDNLDKKRRVLSLRVSKDLRTWTKQEVFLRPDGDDRPETEFYLMKAFRYGAGYAGLLFKYYGDPKLPNKHSALYEHELIVSRDARVWQRPFRGTNLGFWTYADPFVEQGRLHFPIWNDGAMSTVSYAPNRLAAAVAKEEGVFTTAAFAWPEKGIALDADVRGGWIAAALLDEAGATIAEARIEDVEGRALELPWKPRVKVNDVCWLRVRMHGARLYAIDQNRKERNE